MKPKKKAAKKRRRDIPVMPKEKFGVGVMGRPGLNKPKQKKKK